jgi:cytochrome P450
MGLPMEEAPRFLEWNHRILHGYTTDEAHSDHAAAVAGVFEYFATLLAERVQDPRDDVVTFLANVTDDVGGLTLDEQLGICFNLFIAGLDTVAATLVFFLDFLARNPTYSQALRDHPSLIPGASEEMLRYHSFVSPGRIATMDTEISGVPIRKGDRVLLMTGAAGIDEKEFTDALTIDFQRKPNRHFGFGAGPHRCIGSHLARRELVVALEVMHTRTRSYRIDPDADIVRHGGNVGGIDKLMLFVE